MLITFLSLFVAAGVQGQQPPALNIPDGCTLLMTARAEGVVIYGTVADPNSPTKRNWAYKNPEATLYDSAHHRIGRLTVGPSFILDDATNISIDSRHMQSIPSPSPDTMSWQSWPVTIGSMLGAFTGVTTVMRIETSGGVPPSSPPADDKPIKINYSATYVFLGTDLRNPNARTRSIMDTQVGNVDWENITVAEALSSATFFPGIPFFASPDLKTKVNIKAKGLSFGRALQMIGEQGKAEVFLHDGKVYAFPKG